MLTPISCRPSRTRKGQELPACPGSYRMAEVFVIRSSAVSAVALSLVLCAPVWSQDATSPAPPDSPRMPGIPFDELARRASEELKQGRLEDALRFFRAGVELNPRWDEGWWYVGSIQHERQQFAEARDAYRRAVELKPDAGAAWAMMGVCEYRLGHREEALAYLVKGDALGFRGNEEIARLTTYHIAVLLVRSGQFDLPAGYLAKLARSEGEAPDVVAACGLIDPPDAPAPLRSTREGPGPGDGDRTGGLLRPGGKERGGEAALRDADRYVSVDSTCPLGVRALPVPRGVQGRLPMLEKEVSVFPENWQAHQRIALDVLARGTPAEALPHAREAARLAPHVFACHLALGRALIAVDAVAEGTAELEEAARLAPEVPDVYLALAQGYARAGRTEDVEHVRAKLAALHAKSRPQSEP